MAAIIYAIGVLLLAAFSYGLYKIVWYIVKMLKFTRLKKDLTQKGATVEQQRGIVGTVFGKKGCLIL